MPESARTFRLRRSALYVPASNARAIAKARALACDAVILDLEDSVAPHSKSEARATAVSVVREGGFGHRELIVHVNGLDSEWGDKDLSALRETGADAILVPKVRSRIDLLRYEHALSDAHPSMQLWVMIETARCVFRLEEIAAAAAASRLSCFVIGTNDLASELRMRLD